MWQRIETLLIVIGCLLVTLFWFWLAASTSISLGWWA
jgi:hypothetical protein